MRLIDAHILLEKLDKPSILTNRLRPEDKETVRNIVKSQPTAYDIEKVAEELYMHSVEERIPTCLTHRIIDVEEAIEIVKRGGKE